MECRNCYGAVAKMIEPKDAEIARLTKQLTSLKEQLQNVDVLASSLHHDKESLTKQLAAANGRVEMLEKELSKFQESSFNPDWSLLKASQDSLREHMALLHRQNSQIEVLKDLLERAQNGLRWYADMHQEDVSEADGELHIEIDAALTALPQQVKSDARDAERYRYLRSHNAEQFDRLVEDSLDDAIDAAISAQEEKS